MRRRLSLYLLVLLPLCAPTGLYELLQKWSERSSGPPAHWVLLSARAELETPWRPRTRNWIYNHAEHEWQETQRFLLLLRDSL